MGSIPVHGIAVMLVASPATLVQLPNDDEKSSKGTRDQHHWLIEADFGLMLGASWNAQEIQSDVDNLAALAGEPPPGDLGWRATEGIALTYSVRFYRALMKDLWVGGMLGFAMWKPSYPSLAAFGVTTPYGGTHLTIRPGVGVQYTPYNDDLFFAGGSFHAGYWTETKFSGWGWWIRPAALGGLHLGSVRLGLEAAYSLAVEGISDGRLRGAELSMTAGWAF